jgi:hypothetical protein
VRFNDGINSDPTGAFAALRDEKLFREARAILGAVTWPGDLDLAPTRYTRKSDPAAKFLYPANADEGFSNQPNTDTIVPFRINQASGMRMPTGEIIKTNSRARSSLPARKLRFISAPSARQ